MESRCPGCFHPRSVDTDAAAATCPVCDAARTSPFGVSAARPEPPARTMPGPFGASPAHGQTSLFGVPAATPNPFLFSFPPTPPEPAQTSLFGQTSFPPPTPCGVTYTPGPAQTSFPFQPMFGSVWTDTATLVFDDDEPVEEPPEAPLDAESNGGPLVLKTHCELPAVARGCAREGFAVLVHAMAPGAATDHTAPRAPLDLVTVLDVSGSMAGRKLELLKEAMGFVVDKLGPADRLSVVSFSHDARRVSPLARMSDAGKASAKLAVQSLVAGGGTNILKGLQMAARILDRRRQAAPACLAGGDAQCAALVFELGELSARVASRREYEQTGRACVLSGMSSHAQQRASSVSLFATMSATPTFGSAAPGSFGAPTPFGMAAGAYATPSMKAMVDSSRETREQRQQQQSPPPTTTTMPNRASIFAPNNGSS